MLITIQLKWNMVPQRKKTGILSAPSFKKQPALLERKASCWKCDCFPDAGLHAVCRTQPPICCRLAAKLRNPFRMSISWRKTKHIIILCLLSSPQFQSVCDLQSVLTHDVECQVDQRLFLGLNGAVLVLLGFFVLLVFYLSGSHELNRVFFVCLEFNVRLSLK